VIADTPEIYSAPENIDGIGLEPARKLTTNFSRSLHPWGQIIFG
jgi:hypothetical protein